MRRFSLSLLLFLLAAGLAPAHAQQRGLVTGAVVEAESGQALPAATVALWSAADSSLVTGSVTGEDGSFEITGIRPGPYYVRVSYVGYEAETISDVTIGPDRRQVDLGEIALATDAAELDEVEVTAERAYMQFETDRTIYNVQDQPLAVGGSARDALVLLPSVSIDFDGNISLRGNENVAVYLNGDPAPMTGQALIGFLISLPAGAIERVEVIPNPSAAFDPEGSAGIINVVLAKGYEMGLGGGVSTSASTDNSYRVSGNLRYGSGPWNLYANSGLRYGRRQSTGYQFRANRYPDPPTPYLEQDERGESGGFSQYLNTSVDYRLTEANTLTLEATVSRRAREGEDLNAYSELDADRDLTRRYDRRTDDEGSQYEMEYELSFERVLEPSVHELSVEAEVELENGGDQERYTEELLWAEGASASEILERQAVDETEREQEASLEVEYERPLGESLQLEAGYDGGFERLKSRFYSETFDEGAGAFVPDEDLNNAFVYNEQIHAAYAVLEGALGDFGAQFGLRLERALTTFDLTTTGEAFGNNYFSLFPSTHLSYRPTRAHLLRLSYSKRVNRPNTWRLNPFVDFDDPSYRRRGNPELKPEYTHSFELSYTHLGGSYTLSAAPYFRHTRNAITWDERLTDEGYILATYENFATRNSYGLELVATLNLGEWLRLNGSLNAYRQVTDGSNIRTELSSNALGYRTRLRATVAVREGLDLQLSQYYRSPMDVPGGHRGAFTASNLALRQRLLDGRASLSLSAHDLFGTMGHEGWRETERYYQESRRNWGARNVRLSFRYTFGGQGEEQGGRRRRRH